jgi:6-phosphogluconolactonase
VITFNGTRLTSSGETSAVSHLNTPRAIFGAAWNLLLDQVPVDPNRIHRIKGEIDPAMAAQEYESELKRVAGCPPALDLVFLGMGPDGHTASLFPGSEALHPAAGAIVVPNYVAKFSAFRVTLTAGAINAARSVVFLAGGADKAPVVKAVLEGPSQPDLLPSQLIAPSSGDLTWILDRDSAAQLAQ